MEETTAKLGRPLAEGPEFPTWNVGRWTAHRGDNEVAQTPTLEISKVPTWNAGRSRAHQGADEVARAPTEPSTGVPDLKRRKLDSTSRIRQGSSDAH